MRLAAAILAALAVLVAALAFGAAVGETAIPLPTVAKVVANRLFGAAFPLDPIDAADQTMAELRTPGMALGVLEEAPLSEDETTLAAGDVLVCYTDGLTEAINAAEDAFGVERLADVIATHHGGSAAELVAAINTALRRFSERPPFDDLTIVVIKRLAG